MNTTECATFLQRVLPRLGLQWRGYRRVRKLVCKRLARRIAALGLANADAYAEYCGSHPDEWPRLEGMARIPVSRFYRDRSVFAAVERDVLPVLAAAAVAEGRTALDCWSACCASGEEAYTLAMLWQARLAGAWPSLAMHIVATDADPALLERAHHACYAPSSLKELPADLLQAGFDCRDGRCCVRPAARTVTFVQEDIRQTGPGVLYDLILCRNAVMTYFAPSVQEDVMRRVLARLRPGGALVLGMHERLPAPCARGMAAWAGSRVIYRKQIAAPAESPLRCLAPHAEPVVLHGELAAALPPVASP